MERNKVLLIDMYGVIIKESRGYFIPYTLQNFDGSEHERILRLIKEEQYFTKAQRGELTNTEFLSLLGYTEPRKTKEDYLKNYLSLDEAFVSFAEAYSSRYDFCLLSNDVLEWSEFLTEYHGINRYFKRKIVSGEVHMRKPDKNFFAYALSKLDVMPEQCVFVDNSVKNLLAAEELGIATILFNRDKVQYSGSSVNDFAELGSMLSKM